MFPALLSGDFIMVNKLYLGARFYKNIDCVDGNYLEATRIPGYTTLKNNDVVVFNYPSSKSKRRLSMDANMLYVKRCIGLPGDTLAIVKGYYTINGKTGFGNIEAQTTLSHYRGEFESGIYHAFSFYKGLDWNIVNLGPLHIPARGQTVTIDSVNFYLYQRLIGNETDSLLQNKNGNIYLGNTLITHYTFQKNWYFLGGDNVMNSRDSRYIGLLPEDFIIGKASFVFVSQNPYTKKYRWNRFLKRIR
jgi:signal peptidase I